MCHARHKTTSKMMRRVISSIWHQTIAGGSVVTIFRWQKDDEIILAALMSPRLRLNFASAQREYWCDVAAIYSTVNIIYSAGRASMRLLTYLHKHDDLTSLPSRPVVLRRGISAAKKFLEIHERNDSAFRHSSFWATIDSVCYCTMITQLLLKLLHVYEQNEYN